MANAKETNPANSGDGKTLAVEANVHRLDRSPSITSERSVTAEAKVTHPEDRKPAEVQTQSLLRSAPGSNISRAEFSDGLVDPGSNFRNGS